jgi:hypothetical protein
MAIMRMDNYRKKPPDLVISIDTEITELKLDIFD